MIWKVKYRKAYGPGGLYSYDETKLYYDEETMVKELKKLPEGVKGTIQVYENTATYGITEHLDSLKRNVQLTSLLEVDSEKSELYSKFMSLFEKGKDIEHPLAESAMKEWGYLAKNDDSAMKKYFAKHRQLFLNYCLDTEEWYDTLLRIYSYMDITPVMKPVWFYDNKSRIHEKRQVVEKELTEKQKESYHVAKSKIKKEAAESKKKSKTKRILKIGI